MRRFVGPGRAVTHRVPLPCGLLTCRRRRRGGAASSRCPSTRSPGAPSTTPTAPGSPTRRRVAFCPHVFDACTCRARARCGGTKLRGEDAWCLNCCLRYVSYKANSLKLKCGTVSSGWRCSPSYCVPPSLSATLALRRDRGVRWHAGHDAERPDAHVRARLRHAQRR